jgi:hypothetical protein
MFRVAQSGQWETLASTQTPSLEDDVWRRGRDDDRDWGARYLAFLPFAPGLAKPRFFIKESVPASLPRKAR